MKFYIGYILGSFVTAIFALIFAKRIKKTRDRLDNVFEAWRRKNKKIYQISFHEFGEKPIDAEKRLYPPLHAGGRPDKRRNKKFADLDDLLINLMRKKGIDFEPAFGEMRQEYWAKAFPKEPYANPGKLAPIKKATKKSVDRLLITKN